MGQNKILNRSQTYGNGLGLKTDLGQDRLYLLRLGFKSGKNQSWIVRHDQMIGLELRVEYDLNKLDLFQLLHVFIGPIAIDDPSTLKNQNLDH